MQKAAVIKCDSPNELSIDFSQTWPEGRFEGNFQFGPYTTINGQGRFKKIKVGGEDTVIVTEMALNFDDIGLVFVDLLKTDAREVEDAILDDLIENPNK